MRRMRSEKWKLIKRKQVPKWSLEMVFLDFIMFEKMPVPTFSDVYWIVYSRLSVDDSVAV